MSTLDISSLTVAERLDLIGELMDSLSNEKVTPAQQAELARRAEALEFADDDLDWARPFVEEALAQVDRGDVVTLQEFEARLDARFGRLTK